MGEGFILLTKGYTYMGGYHPPFDRLKISTSTDDIKLKLETNSKISLSLLALKYFETISFIVRRRETSMTS